MITFWDPTTQAFATSNGDQLSQSTLLLNILIELRVQTQTQLAIASDVIKDDEWKLRADYANDTPNEVTGPPAANP